MIISATPIWKPQKKRICNHCDKPIEGHTLKLFGYQSGDPAHLIYVHPKCISQKFLKGHSMEVFRVQCAIERLNKPWI